MLEMRGEEDLVTFPEEMLRLRGERWGRIGPVEKLETFLLGRRIKMVGDPEVRGNWHPKELIYLESRQGNGWVALAGEVVKCQVLKLL